MEKSASSPALIRAGRDMSHVPMRATQHGIFRSAKEMPVIDLKPGQASLERQLYSEEAKRLEHTYIGQDIEHGSMYARSIANRPTPDDYKNPVKPIKQVDAANAGCGHLGTAHWKSEYKSRHDGSALGEGKVHRQFGPSYQAINPPTCVGRGEEITSYQAEYGVYGSDPRTKFLDEAALQTSKSVLTAGTAKGTQHIPGYQGFLATNTSNAKVAKVAQGSELRNTTNKANLTATFHANLVGYAGHVPSNSRNDRGGVRMTNQTVKGRDFMPPASSECV